MCLIDQHLEYVAFPTQHHHRGIHIGMSSMLGVLIVSVLAGGIWLTSTLQYQGIWKPVTMPWSFAMITAGTRSPATACVKGVMHEKI